MSERARIESERLRYLWHVGYERSDEYPTDPRWADDIGVEENEQSEGMFTTPSLVFYDRYDPEYVWIKSDTVEDLMDAR